MTPYTSLQQIFDISAAHLLKQGRAATDGSGMCAYRAPDGCMCAVGVLIPDHLYDPSFEGQRVEVILSRIGLDLVKPGLRADHLLTALQKIHDTSHVTSWPTQMVS